MRFVALLLRIDDFMLLTQERVASTFRKDAATRVRQAIEGRANIRENEFVSDRLGEVAADMVLTAEVRKPVALFFGTSAQRVNDAIFLQMAADLGKVEVSVVALLENDSAGSQDLRRRASNRLSTVPVSRHDEDAAIGCIQREVLGGTMH